MNWPPVDLWTRQHIQPYVLAGGLSQRFGSNKCLASVGDSDQLSSLCKALRADFESTPVVIQRRDLTPSVSALKPSPAYSCIVDTIDSQGPMCGIATGLQHMRSLPTAHQNPAPPVWALFVTCDLFRWSPAITQMLLSAINLKKESAKVAVFEHECRLQPFPSLWHYELAEPLMLAANSPQRSIQRWLKAEPNVEVIQLTQPDLIASFNTPDELDRLQRANSKHQGWEPLP